MNKQMSAALIVLVAGLAAGTVQAQQAAAVATSNVPDRAGEASTMTNGVPNLLASNVQPGELGLEGRLTVRPRTVAAPSLPAYTGDPGLKMMGAPGLVRPVLIAPPGTSR